MKKILFNGLGSKDTITYSGMFYRNGSEIEVPDDIADAYVTSGLAMAIASGVDIKEAEALRKLEEKNAKTRERIKSKADAERDVK